MTYPTFTRDHFADIEGYEDAVLSGIKPACQWERLAVERQVRDLERADTDDFPYIFDPVRALKPIRFTECFPHVKGKWAAKKTMQEKLISLSAWQKWSVSTAFGWIHRETLLRRFRLIYIAVPRKNGKSTLASPLALYMVADDGEYGAEVYCGATTEKQAWEVFRPALKMARAQPLYMRQHHMFFHAKKIEKVTDGSWFEPVIGKPGDGSSPHFWIADEYHEHETDEFVDTMITGQGARDNGLGLIITTAGANDAGPCYLQQQEIQQILLQQRNDESVFGIIYTIDDGVDWKSEEALIMANPNAGISVNLDYLRKQQQAAINSPRKQNKFKIKHLDIWVTAAEAWLNSIDVKAAASSINLEDFKGHDAGFGIDLSESDDLTSVVYCFAKSVEGKTHYFFVGKHYATEEKIFEIPLYQGWFDAGWLEQCDGSIIDYQQVEDDIEEFAERHFVERVLYDPAGASILAQRVQNRYDIEAVKFSQNFTNFSPVMRDFESLLGSGRIHHDGNPAFEWMLCNVVAKETRDGKYKRPVKERKSSKIDGAVAGLMAFAAIYTPEIDDGSDQAIVEL